MPVTHVPVSVPDATTYTVLAQNSGLTHIMPDLTADCVVTLPAARAGLEYRFIYGGNAIEQHDWSINATSATAYFLGGLVHIDDAPAANSIISDGNSNDRIVVLVPEGGTFIDLVCDGTNWIASGVVVAASAPSFAD